MDLSIYTKEWLQDHRSEWPNIIAKLDPNADLNSYGSLMKNFQTILMKTEKFPEVEIMQLLYLNNRALSQQAIKSKSQQTGEKVVNILITSYNDIFLNCGEDSQYGTLAAAYVEDIIKEGAEKEFFENILRNGTLARIKSIIDKITWEPRKILWHASVNDKNPEVLEFVYDSLAARGTIFDTKCFDQCRSNAKIIRKMAVNMEITEKMAGQVINSALRGTPENLIDLINYLKERGLNISSAIRSFQDYEDRSPVHNACRDGRYKHLPILIANLEEDDLRYLLVTHQYLRTPLGHANYNWSKSCAEIILKEMERLELKPPSGPQRITINIPMVNEKKVADEE